MASRLLQRWFEGASRNRPTGGWRKKFEFRLTVEVLEERRVLSADAAAAFAVPDLVAVSQAGASPALSAGPTGYTPTQIRHAYGFDQVVFSNGAVGDGTGTTIAIVDAYDDPNIANDLHMFDLAFGLPDPVFTKVNQTGGSTMPAGNKGWAGEIALDVEWAHAIAPGANILLVEATDASYGNLMAAVNYASHFAGVVAVSMSWGGGEWSGETSYDSYFTTPAGHVGVSFFASSGDTGAPVGYPSISNNVVSVGGTTLNLSGGNYGSESGWSGSGGGISAYEAEPNYQKTLVTQTTTKRANPDVAYDSNPSTGFPVYDSYGNGTATPWGQFGGTSDAAPQWAALVAIADQGRAIAGLGSLDGATQLLPALYQLPSTDFHDVTSGTSSGTPKYTAAAGYDLVTGRGSPYANLVIRDLIGQPVQASATHFSVSAPASATAGGTFSVTVTALDASNNAFSGYLGKVHFTDTDTASGVALPADYTFTAADHGVHTFTGLKLVTAGTQTLSVKDTVTSTITGTVATTVTPAAAAKLTFGAQPTSGTVGTPLGSAVTVNIFDAYGNLLTSDNTDQVTLSLGNNPGGATLGGTTAVKAVGGVATFSNLTLSAAGSGYTLVAKLGSLPAATSASFNMTAQSTGGAVEGFETGNLSAYKTLGASAPSATVTTSAKHDGTYGLSDVNGNDWIYRTDAAATVKAGDTISVWLKFNTVAADRAYLGFGTTATGTLALVAAPNTNQLILQYVDFRSSATSGGVFTQLAAVTQTWQANQWYRLEVNWSSTGAMIGKVYAADGVTQLNSVQGTQLAGEPVITSGGIGFRGFGSYAKSWDTVQTVAGVNSFRIAGMHAQDSDGTSFGDYGVATPVSVFSQTLFQADPPGSNVQPITVGGGGFSLGTISELRTGGNSSTGVSYVAPGAVASQPSSVFANYGGKKLFSTPSKSSPTTAAEALFSEYAAAKGTGKMTVVRLTASR